MDYKETYKGIDIHHAMANASGIKYIAHRTDWHTLKADTLQGIKMLINKYK